MKKGLLILLVILMCWCFMGASCEYNQPKTVEDNISAQQKALTQEANAQIGLPNITNFYEKKMAKQILELRDDSKLVCYAYTLNEYTGKFIYLGQCMGFGLPYSTQYTNPEFITYDQGQYAGGNVTLPQADPNGLYMPSSASATWLMMINEDSGKVEAMYVESNVTVKQTKVPKRLCDVTSLPSNY